MTLMDSLVHVSFLGYLIIMYEVQLEFKFYTLLLAIGVLIFWVARREPEKWLHQKRYTSQDEHNSDGRFMECILILGACLYTLGFAFSPTVMIHRWVANGLNWSLFFIWAKTLEIIGWIEARMIENQRTHENDDSLE